MISYKKPKKLYKILKRFRDAQIVVPGHGNYGGLELLTHTLNLIEQYTE